MTKVLDASVEELGIAVGQEVLSINGDPVKTFAQKHVQPFVSASTPQDLQLRVFGDLLLRGPVDQPVEIELKSLDGATFDVSLPRQAGKSRVAKFLSRRPAFEFQLLDGNIAHIKLNSFGSSQALTEFAEAFDEIQQADGLILDLRANSGGNSGVGWRILGYLTDESFATTQWHMYEYRPTFRAWNRAAQFKYQSLGSPFPPHGSKHYQKPVAMLIGARTFSAAEDMAAAFDMMDRGQLIGQATGGSTGQPLSFDLPGGGRARVCTKHDLYADGTPFVGVGIQPDLVVQPTLEDLRNGIDRELLTAQQQLAKEIKQ